MNILLSGGTGYIGSHTCTELLNAGHSVVTFDNLSNSEEKVNDAVVRITGKPFKFYLADMLDMDALRVIFEENTFDAVIHFAGLKAVGESVQLPLKYYHNNITGTLNLLSLIEEYHVKSFVFSSSATVYGDPASLPITEDFPLGTTNPYGSTKLMIEQILKDFYAANSGVSISILRYFNPVGAHESGEIGENPKGIPNNLMPYIAKVAAGQLEALNVFGDRYPTRDGTGIRDYIHVVDLAIGHLKALEKNADTTGVHIYNLGTGTGYSVLEVLRAMEAACGHTIPYKIAPPRSGDIAACYADPGKAQKELGWAAERDLKQMCEDAWRWQKKNLNL